MATDDELQRRLNVALDAAQAAGRLTLKYFRRGDLEVERKADDSPVTIADRSAEQLLREQIGGEFPGDALLGEEFPEREGTSGYRWVFDPIDGTKSFIHGVPLYGCLVGLEREGRPVLGIVGLPALGELTYAVTGGGAWHVMGDAAPRRISVSRRSALAESLFLTSEVKNFRQRNAIDAFDRLDRAARLSRTWGDCFGYVMVATGRAEVMVDPLMNVWDAAAVMPIIEEAGGRFSDWRGQATIHSGDALATNGLVHEEVLALLGAAK